MDLFIYQACGFANVTTKTQHNSHTVALGGTLLHYNQHGQGNLFKTILNSIGQHYFSLNEGL